jgi:two-component system CheB/CheR fusion protein
VLSKGGAIVIIVFSFTNCHSLICEVNGMAKGPKYAKNRQSQEENQSDLMTGREDTSRKSNPQATKRKKSFPVVGMGASAGGLEALQRFFATMPSDSGMAFLVVQHLDPTHESMMTQVLARSTSMKVVQAANGMAIEENQVYVIPPNRYLGLSRGALQVITTEDHRGQRMPVDFLFHSLAEDQQDHAICIILSGTGTDGTSALRDVSALGGISMVQEPSTARYDGMPKSAIDSGYADYVLPVEEMPGRLLGYVKNSFGKGRVKATGLPDPSGILSKILLLVRSGTGHDFSSYKKNTLYRRIERRMRLFNIADLNTYHRFLQDHPDEVSRLFKEIIIRVTSFFRDPEAFEMLGARILPLLLDGKKERDIRVWVPGCSTGEEAYAIAILLKEYIEGQERDFKVQIFGTDIDEEAIARARTGYYPASIARDVTPGRLNRFFHVEKGGFRIRKHVRDDIVFAAQNVIRDAPFTRLDLVSCRNLLIYLDGDLQGRLLPLFHYSLRPGGVLFLGSSESIGVFSDFFAPMDRKWKFFQAKPSKGRDYVMEIASPARITEGGAKESEGDKKSDEVSAVLLAQKALLDRFGPPSVLINEKGDIEYFYGDTGSFLQPPHGRPANNVIDMARKGLRHPLLVSLRAAVMEKKEIALQGLRVKTNGAFERIDLLISPIRARGDGGYLFLVTFQKASLAMAGTFCEGLEDGDKSNRRAQELEMELKYTKESLHANIEELQASNEELKSANEELQSTNEELQSTNEEMETSKEELQSVNEELTTVNGELESKIDQLSETESVLKNLLDNTNVGTVFLDEKLKIIRFTVEAVKVINLIPADVGRPLAHIVTNLHNVDLVGDAQDVLDTLLFTEKEVRSKRGDWYLMRIMPYRAPNQTIEGVVLSFTNITLAKALTEEQAARRYAESIVDAVREPLVLLDAELRVISVNDAFNTTFNISRGEATGKLIYDLGDKTWDIPELRHLLGAILRENTVFRDFKVPYNAEQERSKVMLLNARAIMKDETPFHILLGIEVEER